jgi:hypothetical protein
VGARASWLSERCEASSGPSDAKHRPQTAQARLLTMRV